MHHSKQSEKEAKEVSNLKEISGLEYVLNVGFRHPSRHHP